jgi:single-strand DNA-binding protein
VLNRIFLIGNVGRIETKQNPDGSAFTKFSLAVSGKKDQESVWFDCIAFGKVGELTHQFLDVGSKTFVGGRLEIRKYQGKDGLEKTGHTIIVSEFEAVSSRKQADATATAAEDAPF